MSTAATTRRRLQYGRASLDQSAAAGLGPLVFTASTTGLNRYGFSLRSSGWRLANFNANPVFLWMHDANLPPIGRAPATLEGGRLRTAVTFDQDDPFARIVERKYRGGFLSAVSVGWDFVNADGSPITDWWRLKPEQMRDEAFYDLAEISAVPVPGDPGAVVDQQSLALRSLARELLNAIKPPHTSRHTGAAEGRRVDAHAARKVLAALDVPSFDVQEARKLLLAAIEVNSYVIKAELAARIRRILPQVLAQVLEDHPEWRPIELHPALRDGSILR